MNQTIQQEIASIVQQLVTYYNPEKIILFGSAARGDMGPDSDLDFFLVKKNVPYRGIDRHSEILDRVRYRIASDFIVVTPDELSERLALGDPFVSDIVTNGKVLYG